MVEYCYLFYKGTLGIYYRVQSILIVWIYDT